MTMKQTSVIINVDKWNTLKSRGYKLQDIVDTAFNNLLDINLSDNLEHNKELNNLSEKKKHLLNDMENTRKMYDDKIEDINHTLNKVEEEKEIALNNIEKEIKDIDFKIKAIEETIKTNEEAAEEEKRISEEKLNYLRQKNMLLNSIHHNFNRFAKSNPNGLRMDFFNNDPESAEFCKKYDLTLEDLSKIIYKKQLGKTITY